MGIDRSSSRTLLPRETSIDRGTFFRRFALLLSVAAVGVAAAGSLSRRYTFVFNASPSLEYTVLILRRGPVTLRRDALVAVRPPPTPEYPAGLHAKRLLGLPGDCVRIEPLRRTLVWRINGEAIGTVRAETREGRPLAPGPAGRIPLGRVAVGSRHPLSLDSRYADVGWLAVDRIAGALIPLW